MPNTFRDIPLAGDLISVSQADLKQNFDYIQGALGKDHQINFGSSDTGTSFEGRHKQLSLNNRNGGVPTITDGADSIVYGINGNLAWTSASSAGPVQLTNVKTNAVTNATSGCTFLPGGILLQWGNTANTGITTVVHFVNTFSTVYTCVAVPTQPDRTAAVTVVGNASFTFVMDNAAPGQSIRWFAVGAYI